MSEKRKRKTDVKPARALAREGGNEQPTVKRDVLAGTADTLEEMENDPTVEVWDLQDELADETQPLSDRSNDGSSAGLRDRQAFLEHENAKLKSELTSALRARDAAVARLRRENPAQVGAPLSAIPRDSRDLERNALEDAKERLEAEIERLRAASVATIARISQLEADLEEAWAAADQATEQGDRMRSSLREAQEAVRTSEERLKGQSRRIVQLEEQLGSTSSELSALRDSRDRMTGELVAVQAKLRQASVRTELGTEPGPLAERLAQTVAVMETTLQDREAMQSDATGVRTSLKQAEDNAHSLQNELAGLGEELSGAQEALRRATVGLASATEVVRQRQDDPDQGGGFVTGIRAILDNMSGQLSEVHRRVAAWEGARNTVGPTPKNVLVTLIDAHDAAEAKSLALSEVVDRVELYMTSLSRLEAALRRATVGDESLQGEVARRDAILWEELQRLKGLRDNLLGERGVDAHDPNDSLSAFAKRPLSGSRRTASGPFAAATASSPNTPRPSGSTSRPTAEPERAGPSRRGRNTTGQHTTVSSASLRPVPARRANERAIGKLFDSRVPARERLRMLLEERPTLRNQALTNSMEISAKAAFLASQIDGSMSLGDLIDTSGLSADEASEILVGLLMQGHIKIPILEQ